jgi:hypothetical protein
MTGHATPFPRGVPTRGARDLVAVLYRQAGLIAVCACVGTAASRVIEMRQPRVDVSSEDASIQAEPPGAPSLPSGAAAYRDDPYPDAADRMEGGLKLDLNPETTVAAAALTSVAAALTTQMPGPQLRLDEAGRYDADAPDRPTWGQKDKTVGLMGPFAGLLVGLLLAAPRELGGDRMRSAREVERALGAPVLGAIPTLSARARSAYLGSSAAERAATQLA